MLGEQRAVEVLQRQFGHGHPLSGVVAHGEGGCSPSCHGHALLLGTHKGDEISVYDTRINNSAKKGSGRTRSMWDIIKTFCQDASRKV